MKTKSQLLAEMKRLNACPDATFYVSGHTSRSANKIGQDCTEPSWLIWFLTRQNVDLSAFTFGCADRACRIYAHAALEKAGKVEEAAKLRALPKIVDRETALRARGAVYYADRTGAVYYAARTGAVYYAAAAARAADHYAADHYVAAAAASASARYAARAGAEECKIQLTELKALGKEWANG